MRNKSNQSPKNINSFSINISPSDQKHLNELYSGVISFKMLQFLEKEMQPYHKYFNVVEIALLVDKYIDIHLATKEKEP